MPVLIAGLQARVKNSYSFAEELGLMLIANGEELPYLLTPQGEQIQAGITPGAVAPIITNDGAGSIPDTKWVVYAYVYVSENSFPLVAPRLLSNPSPLSDAFEITGGNSQLDVEMVGSDNPLVSHVYVFRTAPQDTEVLADTAAAAGALNYVGSIANAAGTLNYTDNLASAIGNEPIDYTHFTVPQFRFVVWDGSYFWGFANHPFSAEATWDMDGTFTLDNPSIDKFYGGRDDQFITFDSIHVGGIDNRGTFLFRQTGDFTGKVVDENGDDVTLPSATTGNITIVGQTANLYRSAYRNPWSWGYLQNVGGVYVPVLWELKVSGSLGTAIAIIPDQQMLKLDMEFPALCLTFNLTSAATDIFASTKRQVSRLHSVTSHGSQFNAISKGRSVLWGMDFKNLAIVECDGYTQVPVSGPISTILRGLSTNRSLHMLAHGIYDPATEINAIWLSTSAVDEEGAPVQFDLCVYQHAPTGFWGVFTDLGILCSAAVEDPVTSRRNTLVGTETGFVGKAFDVSTYGNWLPNDSIWSGKIRAASGVTIFRSEGQDDFNPLDAGLIGNFVIIVDANGLNSQIRKIVGATGDSLILDLLDPMPPTTEEPGLTDDTQWKFFIGLIELRVLKYYNNGEPNLDKVPREVWATLADAENPHVEYFNEHSESPEKAVVLKRDKTLDAWFNKMDFPTAKGKSFGLALVERSYNPTKFYDITQK